MGWSDAYDAHADLWRTTLVLGGFHETGLARVPRSGQRRYWHCSERRSIWRETPRCEAVEGSGFWSTGGGRGSRRKYGPRGLYGSLSLCRVCAALFSEKSRRGAQTPKPDVELVSQRLRLARQDTRSDMAKSSAERSGKIVRSSGNVFADLGLADSGGGSKSAAPKVGSTTATKAAQTVNALVAGIPQKGNVLGSPTAPVTLQYFGDLECPICKDFTLGALPTVIQKWVRPGKLQIEYRSLETATREPETFKLQQIA